MASYQVRDSCSPHGFSKAQLCFFKILRLISSVPPSQPPPPPPRLTPKHDPSHSSPNTTGFDVDLNLGFRSLSDNTEFECSATNSSDIEQTEGGDKSEQVSLVTDTKETNFQEQIGEDRESKELDEGCETVPFAGKARGGYDNCLDLLIEAAKLVFEEPSGERGPASELRTRRRNEGEPSEQRWVVVDFCDKINDMSPVVRSKRGRSQALPFRFRDSVVEPLKRSATTRASRKRLVGS